MAVPRKTPVVDAYGGGGFRVSGARIEGSILILNDEVLPWPVTALAGLGPEQLRPVLDLGSREVEFLLLGVGVRNAPPRARSAPAPCRAPAWGWR